MKKYLEQIAKYNGWANSIVIQWLKQLSMEQYKKHITSSFNSIEKTALHITSAEKIWHERWVGISSPFLQENFKEDLNALIEIWENASQHILQFVEKISEEQLQNIFEFKRINGEQLSQTYADSIVHVINHSTFHRGQLITMLRQVGFVDLFSTDYITYIRNN